MYQAYDMFLKKPFRKKQQKLFEEFEKLLKKNKTVKYKLEKIFFYMFFEGSKILWKFEFFRDPDIIL